MRRMWLALSGAAAVLSLQGGAVFADEQDGAIRRLNLEQLAKVRAWQSEPAAMPSRQRELPVTPAGQGGPLLEGPPQGMDDGMRDDLYPDDAELIEGNENMRSDDNIMPTGGTRQIP